jgi:hypothetical protein
MNRPKTKNLLATVISFFYMDARRCRQKLPRNTQTVKKAFSITIVIYLYHKSGCYSRRCAFLRKDSSVKKFDLFFLRLSPPPKIGEEEEEITRQ